MLTNVDKHGRRNKFVNYYGKLSLQIGWRKEKRPKKKGNHVLKKTEYGIYPGGIQGDKKCTELLKYPAPSGKECDLG